MRQPGGGRFSRPRRAEIRGWRETDQHKAVRLFHPKPLLHVHPAFHLEHVSVCTYISISMKDVCVCVRLNTLININVNIHIYYIFILPVLNPKHRSSTLKPATRNAESHEKGYKHYRRKALKSKPVNVSW